MSIDTDSKEFKDALSAALEEQTQGLKDKNTELLGKLKKAQAGSTIDPADLEAVEKERDQLRADLATAKKDAKKVATELEAATKRAADAEGYTSKLLVDNGLTDALVKAGVTDPVYQKAAKAMLASQVQIADDNGTKVPKFGDKDLATAITDWAGSEDGKRFVSAADTSGSGSQNPGRTTTTSTGDMGGDKAQRLARAEQLLKQNAA